MIYLASNKGGWVPITEFPLTCFGDFHGLSPAKLFYGSKSQLVEDRGKTKIHPPFFSFCQDNKFAACKFDLFISLYPNPFYCVFPAAFALFATTQDKG